METYVGHYRKVWERKEKYTGKYRQVQERIDKYTRISNITQ